MLAKDVFDENNQILGLACTIRPAKPCSLLRGGLIVAMVLRSSSAGGRAGSLAVNRQVSKITVIGGHVSAILIIVAWL